MSPRVIPCRVCGADSLTGACEAHEQEQRRARRHDGYDDPVYRRYRARRKGSPCDRCRRTVGRIVHHVDGDPGHNVKGNYEWLCGPCATEADEAMRAERDRRLAPGRPPRGGRRSPWK